MLDKAVAKFGSQPFTAQDSGWPRGQMAEGRGE